MPIPPRPIPNAHNPAHRRVRPGSSVPRKSLASLDKLDWRSEVSILNDYPRSLPTGTGVSGASSGSSGVKGVKVEQSLPKPKDLGGSEVVRREVELEGLIAESAGKREKRATTATTLGFDFVANPSIVALPDPAPRPTRSSPSLLAQTKHNLPGSYPINISNATATTTAATNGRSSPALSNTPSTPALIPQRQSYDPLVNAEEDDLDDWEHVDVLPEPVTENRDDLDSQSEEDVIVLGELELEDELDLVDLRRGKKHAAKIKASMGTARQGVSYAAAVGVPQKH